MTGEAPPKRTYVIFHGDINVHSRQWITQTLCECVRAGVPEVHLAMSSTGGNLHEATTLYHMLKSCPVRLIVHNVGSVNSAAIAVFAAGKTRYAAPGAAFRFHRMTSAPIHGPQTIQQLHEAAQFLAGEADLHHNVIAAETDFSSSDVEALFSGENWLSAQQAQAHSLIDEIRDFSLDSGAPVVVYAPPLPGPK